jgi:hypothetical protein
MSKYGESLGIWELKIGGVDLKIIPTADDLLNFRNMMMDNTTKGDTKKRLDLFDKFIFDIIKRDVPPVDEKEENELKMYVRLNINDLFDETMITFKWLKREDLEEQKNKLKDIAGDKIKNLIEGN